MGNRWTPPPPATWQLKPIHTDVHASATFSSIRNTTSFSAKWANRFSISVLLFRIFSKLNNFFTWCFSIFLRRQYFFFKEMTYLQLMSFLTRPGTCCTKRTLFVLRNSHLKAHPPPKIGKNCCLKKWYSQRTVYKEVVNVQTILTCYNSRGVTFGPQTSQFNIHHAGQSRSLILYQFPNSSEIVIWRHMLALKLNFLFRWLSFFRATEFACPFPSETVCLCQSAVRFNDSLCEQEAALYCNSDKWMQARPFHNENGPKNDNLNKV